MFHSQRLVWIIMYFVIIEKLLVKFFFSSLSSFIRVRSSCIRIRLSCSLFAFLYSRSFILSLLFYLWLYLLRVNTIIDFRFGPFFIRTLILCRCARERTARTHITNSPDCWCWVWENLLLLIFEQSTIFVGGENANPSKSIGKW